MYGCSYDWPLLYYLSDIEVLIVWKHERSSDTNIKREDSINVNYGNFWGKWCHMARSISLMEKATLEVPELILYLRGLFCNTACSCSLIVETKYMVILE